MENTENTIKHKNLTALFMAWGNFTVIPCPYKHWDSRLNHRMLMYLPVIGAVIGIVWVLILTVLRRIGLPSLLTAAFAEFLLFRLCGYMHLDGFMDVSDEVMSRRPLEERQRILKDSRVGAFAAVSLVFLLILWFAAAASLFSSAAPGSAEAMGQSERHWAAVYGGGNARLAYCMLPSLLALVPVFSRACAGRMVLTYAPIRTSQYAEGKNDPDQWKYRIGVYVLSALAAVLFCGLGSVLYVHGHGISAEAGLQRLGLFSSTLIFALGLMFIMWTAGWTACRHARRQLGGMNGDIAGYTICISELAGMIALALIYL